MNEKWAYSFSWVRVGFAMIAVSLVSPIAHANTPEQIKNAEDGRKYQIDAHTPKCTGDILISVNGTKMVVPRASDFIREDGTDIKRDLRHPLYDCSLKFLDHIGVVKTGGLQLSTKRSPYLKPDLYSPERKLKGLAHARAYGKSTVLPSGVEKIILSTMGLYILPLAKAPTGDNDTAVFMCAGEEQRPRDRDSCGVSYELPNKLRLLYSTKWHHNDAVDDFLRIDREKRSYVESLIQKGKQAQPPGDAK